MKALIISALGTLLLGATVSERILGAETTVRPAPPKRLTPSQRLALVRRLEQRQPTDPQILRQLTNSAPWMIVGGTNRVAQRINRALKK